MRNYAMKRQSVLPILLVTLSLSGASVANAADLNLEQVGDNHFIDYKADGLKNSASIYQDGETASFTGSVSGKGNEVYILQTGKNSAAELSVTGHYNDVDILQGTSVFAGEVGTDNFADVLIVGNDNGVTIQQGYGQSRSRNGDAQTVIRGNENKVYVGQEGKGASTAIHITGNDNDVESWALQGRRDLTVAMNGDANDVKLQLDYSITDVAINGHNNKIDGDIRGEPATIRQTGIGNQLQVDAERVHVQASQDGSYNTMDIIGQYSRVNSAQIGNDNSMIIRNDSGAVELNATQDGNQNQMRIMDVNERSISSSFRRAQNSSFEQIGNGNEMEYVGTGTHVQLAQAGNSNSMFIGNTQGQFTKVSAAQIGSGNVAMINSQ